MLALPHVFAHMDKKRRATERVPKDSTLYTRTQKKEKKARLLKVKKSTERWIEGEDLP